jgi:hypothetical protein
MHPPLRGSSHGTPPNRGFTARCSPALTESLPRAGKSWPNRGQRLARSALASVSSATKGTPCRSSSRSASLWWPLWRCPLEERRQPGAGEVSPRSRAGRARALRSGSSKRSSTTAGSRRSSKSTRTASAGGGTSRSAETGSSRSLGSARRWRRAARSRSGDASATPPDRPHRGEGDRARDRADLPRGGDALRGAEWVRSGLLRAGRALRFWQIVRARMSFPRGYSSVGRAPGSHPGGRRFEPG